MRSVPAFNVPEASPEADAFEDPPGGADGTGGKQTFNATGVARRRTASLHTLVGQRFEDALSPRENLSGELDAWVRQATGRNGFTDV